MICAHRTDSPGFFTTCNVACAGPCRCGEDVRAEDVAQAVTTAAVGDSGGMVAPNPTDVISGRNGTIQ